MVFLSAGEVFRLAEAIGSPSGRRGPMPEYGLLVKLAAFTGLRAGEIAALRLARLDLLHGRLEVAESVEEVHGRLVYGPPKTYAVRTVPVPRSLAGELEVHLSRRQPAVGGFLFASPDGGPMRHSNFYRRFFKPAVLRAGLQPSTRFHDLRHTAAALMINEGAHLLAVKERLGHSTIQVTADRYGHLFPSLEAALTDRLDDAYRAARAEYSDRSRLG
jgi:integrase